MTAGITGEQTSHPIFKRFVYKSTEYSHRICMISLALIFIASMIDIVANKVFMHPVTGCVELIEELMVISVFLAFGFTELDKGHLKVDVIPFLFPVKIRRILRNGSYIFGSILIVILAWRNFALICLYWEFGSVKQVYFYFPLWPTALLMLCGSVAFVISLIYSMLHPPKDYL